MASEQFREEIGEIKENVKDVNRWIRGFFMLVFLVIQWFIKGLTDLIALFQFVNNLLTGDSNERLRQWGSVLAEYSREVVRYLTYNTEQRPFPFSDLPKPEDEDDTVTPAPKKTAAKKRPAKKKAAGKAAEADTQQSSDQPAATDTPAPEAPPEDK